MPREHLDKVLQDIEADTTRELDEYKRRSGAAAALQRNLPAVVSLTSAALASAALDLAAGHSPPQQLLLRLLLTILTAGAISWAFIIRAGRRWVEGSVHALCACAGGILRPPSLWCSLSAEEEENRQFQEVLGKIIKRCSAAQSDAEICEELGKGQCQRAGAPEMNCPEIIFFCGNLAQRWT